MENFAFYLSLNPREGTIYVLRVRHPLVLANSHSNSNMMAFPTHKKVVILVEYCLGVTKDKLLNRTERVKELKFKKLQEKQVKIAKE